LRLSPNTNGIFDALHDAAVRLAHLRGPIAQALLPTRDLLAKPLAIEQIRVLGLKDSAAT